MNDHDALRFNSEAFALAQARMKSAPLDLTERDFDQLGIVSKTLETDAYEARRLAQLAVVQPGPEPPALVTKSSTPPTPETLDEWLQKNGKREVTYAGLTKVIQEFGDHFIALIKTQKLRIDALKKANTDLQARILELEAQAAARSAAVHADR